MSSLTRQNAEAMQKASFIGVPVDVRRGAGMDLNSPAGMALAVLLLLSIVQGGLIGGGSPCSSFVWISRGSTGRSKAEPEGDRSRRPVALANKLSQFVCILVRIAILRRVRFFIEQPASSLMMECRWWTAFFEELHGECKPVFLWMKSFGHAMAKPTKLWSSIVHIESLSTKMTRQRLKQGTGNKAYVKRGKWICGTADLKKSQEYPTLFCEAIVKLFARKVAPGRAQGWAAVHSMCHTVLRQNAALLEGGIVVPSPPTVGLIDLLSPLTPSEASEEFDMGPTQPMGQWTPDVDDEIDELMKIAAAGLDEPAADKSADEGMTDEEDGGHATLRTG